ncbi:hypothetical protein KXD96_03160 [Mycobacterium sp. SMC-2]|uniref:hypothetical protein n=1 Tax=Mycobacterium sp. SMC-2 TaxID=2857058 RepID=UPI0021B48C1B|nr:hypothetical protein [Mycobacterium sp. SMC-2]UXA07174.1 hypothetical protein KXD96_03160 [Mycobacterium sp. SMC-2]
MFKRGTLVFAAAIVALTVGLLALRFPVFIDDYDQFGWKVKCGNGFTTDLAQASSADANKNEHEGAMPSANYVGQCDDALMIRRAWAIPAAALGGLTLVGLAGVTLAHDRRRIRS